MEAESNERIARFSLELGVRADVHVTSMPAVPISVLEAIEDFDEEFDVGTFAQEPEIRGSEFPRTGPSPSMQ